MTLRIIHGNSGNSLRWDMMSAEPETHGRVESHRRYRFERDHQADFPFPEAEMCGLRCGAFERMRVPKDRRR